MDVDARATNGMFGAYACSDKMNGTGAMDVHGMSFNEFGFFARECGLVPRYLSTAQLLVIFRHNRRLHGGDYGLEYPPKDAVQAQTANVPAHMDLEGFRNALVMIALKYVRRTRRELKLRGPQDDDHMILEESPREKTLLLLKTIADSHGIRMMALKPRRAAQIRFVSRSTGFR